MTIQEAIKFLEEQVKNPSEGLPDEIFYYISRMTPMINVDLLIKDEKGRTLLAWRDDEYSGIGWHVPGGIIRFKEKMETRLQKVAQKEIGREVEYDPIPLTIKEVFRSDNTRGHFISILYKCFLPGDFIPDNGQKTEKDPGYLKWHKTCPENILPCHLMYKEFM